MANITSIATPVKGVWSLDITKIRMNPENTRTETGFLRDLPLEIAIALENNTLTDSQKATLQEIVESGSDTNSFGWLVKSVAQVGVEKPLEGYFDPSFETFCAIDGNTRYIAALAANILFNTEIKRISGKVLTDLSEQALLLRQFNSNEGGVSLTPYSKAVLAKKLLKTFGGDLDETSKALCVQKVVLEGYLSVLSLSEAAQTAIKNGEASVTAVAEIIREESKTTSPKEVLETVSTAIVEAVTSKRGRPKGSTKATKNDIKNVVSKKKPKNEVKILQMKGDIIEYCSDRNNLMEIIDSLDQRDLKILHDILSGKQIIREGL